ncbi:MAG: HD domain-containing protein [Candidatus Humimicrobiaceae bacterium]
MSKGKEESMDREQALKLVKEKIKNKNLVSHCLAVEAIMRRLAEELNERDGNRGLDEDKWAITGLVHDIDYDETAKEPDKHSLIGAEVLKDLGFTDDIVYAVKVHNQMHGLPLKNDLDKALYAADPISGLIVAAALIRPEKKLNAVNAASVLKRFGEKAFARGANREQIMACEELGINLEDFIKIALESMQKIDKELGL